MDPQKYPLDCDALKKGDILSHAELVTIVGPKPTGWEQRLAFLALKGLIERKRPDLPAIRLQLDGSGQDHYRLVVLLDWEASEYQHKRCGMGARTIGRSLHRQMAVDTATFTAEQHKTYAHRLQHDARIYLALKSAQHQQTVVPPENLQKLIGTREKNTQREDAIERARVRAERRANGGVQ